MTYGGEPWRANQRVFLTTASSPLLTLVAGVVRHGPKALATGGERKSVTYRRYNAHARIGRACRNTRGLGHPDTASDYQLKTGLLDDMLTTVDVEGNLGGRELQVRGP